MQYVPFKQVTLLLIKYPLPIPIPCTFSPSITSYSSLSLLSFPWLCIYPLYLFHSLLPSHFPSCHFLLPLLQTNIFILYYYGRFIFAPLFFHCSLSLFSILYISWSKVSLFHSLPLIFFIYLLLFSPSSQPLLLHSYIPVFSFILRYASPPSTCHLSTCLKHHLLCLPTPPHTTPSTCKWPSLRVVYPVPSLCSCL